MDSVKAILLSTILGDDRCATVLATMLHGYQTCRRSPKDNPKEAEKVVEYCRARDFSKSIDEFIDQSEICSDHVLRCSLPMLNEFTNLVHTGDYETSKKVILDCLKNNIAVFDCEHTHAAGHGELEAFSLVLYMKMCIDVMFDPENKISGERSVYISYQHNMLSYMKGMLASDVKKILDHFMSVADEKPFRKLFLQVVGVLTRL
jgi:hypothetical protein